MNKHTLKIMLAYIGVLTGAGLASGQELLQYFVALGIPGLVGIGLVGLLHMLIGGILLILGSHYLATDHSEVFDEISNKFISKFMDISLIFTCFVVGFVMIAGAGSSLPANFNNLGLSVINYFGMCLMTAVSMGFVLGGDELNTENAGWGGLFGGAVVGIMGFLITLTLFLRVKEVYTLDIPMLYILEDISPILGLIMAVVIFGMIFNTGISLFYALARRFSNDDEGRFKKMLVLITGLGFVLSFLGFKSLVSMFYPIIGYIGIFMTGLLIFAYFKERTAIRRESMKRLGIRHYMRKKLDDDIDFTPQDEERLNKLIDRSHIDNEEMAEKAQETIQEAIDNDEEAETNHD